MCVHDCLEDSLKFIGKKNARFFLSFLFFLVLSEAIHMSVQDRPCVMMPKGSIKPCISISESGGHEDFAHSLKI